MKKLSTVLCKVPTHARPPRFRIEIVLGPVAEGTNCRPATRSVPCIAPEHHICSCTTFLCLWPTSAHTLVTSHRIDIVKCPMTFLQHIPRHASCLYTASAVFVARPVREVCAFELVWWSHFVGVFSCQKESQTQSAIS